MSVKCFLLEPVGDPDGKLWKRAGTGEVKELRDFGPGAMWFATWMDQEAKGPEGQTRYGWNWDNQFTPPLIVRLPGGCDWDVDSRASNCTMKEDRLHRCWIRHGEPPNVTVDKRGLTCGAGAGSILTDNYHGFLQNGVLT